MSRPMTLNVRVNGVLAAFVAENIGDIGTHENASDYCASASNGTPALPAP